MTEDVRGIPPSSSLDDLRADHLGAEQDEWVRLTAEILRLWAERSQMRWLVAAVVRGAVGAGPRGKKWADGSCPHGTTPYYPTHAWWCDECWTALYDAIYYGKIIVTGGKLMLSL